MTKNEDSCVKESNPVNGNVHTIRQKLPAGATKPDVTRYNQRYIDQNSNDRQPTIKKSIDTGLFVIQQWQYTNQGIAFGDKVTNMVQTTFIW